MWVTKVFEKKNVLLGMFDTLEADRISCVTFFYTSSSRDMGVENSVAGDDYEGNMANNGEANDDGVVLGVKQMTVWMLKRIG